MMREKLTLGWRGKCAPVVDAGFIECVAPARTPSARRTEAPLRIDPWTEPDPLWLCLDLWKTWMAGDSDRDLGTKTMGGLASDGSEARGPDLYEAQQASDARVAQATDAMIDSMSRLHIWAIYRMCSQATPWNFPHASLIEVGPEACAELTRRLKNNVCTGVLF